MFQNQQDAQTKLGSLTAHELRLMSIVGVMLVMMLVAAAVGILVILAIIGFFLTDHVPPTWLVTMAGLSFGTVFVLGGLRLMVEGIMDVHSIITKMRPEIKSGRLNRIRSVLGGLIALLIGVGVLTVSVTAILRDLLP